MSESTKVAVVGVGRFGRHHARVYHELPDAELVGVYDKDAGRAAEVAKEYHCRSFARLEDLFGAVEAASVAVPTEQHAEVGERLIEAGIDVLIEKPMARSVAEADRLIAAAERRGRILQVGHLERFNPAVAAARGILSTPLFFEVHRLSVFTERSLDVDVVLDLMIHDLDIVLLLAGSEPEEIRASGLAVLTPKIDIANVRLAFENGCVANFTASRVSLETVRKLRWFQPREYISVDYARQDATVTKVEMVGGQPKLSHRRLEPPRQEPLQLQLSDFLNNVRTRRAPEIGGIAGRRALRLAHQILEQIERHHERLMKHAGAAVAPVPTKM
jgi:predicted dehydrogenase